MVKSEHPDIKILAFDHNKDHLLDWTKTIIGNDNGYVDGMAFHCKFASYFGANYASVLLIMFPVAGYSNGERIEDGTNGYDAVNASHHYAPDKIMLATEGCSCPGVQLNDWLRAERLGHDVMFDINNYAQGWIDWNLLVDHEGGPNHLGNVCDAAMICNKDYTEVHVQPSFYYMAHFSKFAPPGSKRIKSTIVGDYQYKGSDSNVQAGLQVGMYSCEKSVRQMWKIDSKNGVIGFYHYMKDAKSKDPDLCVAAGTESVAHIRLVDCSYKKAQLLRVFMNEVGQLVDATTGMCVGLNGDVREPGALLDLFPCIGKDSKHSNDHQIFSVDKKTGEIKSKVMDMCMTANWPLLNSVAFTTLQMKTVVVVMNEADIPATVVLSDGTKKGDFGFAIDARSIQTLIY